MDLEILKLYKNVRESIINPIIEDKDVRGLVPYYPNIIDDIEKLHNHDLCTGIYTLVYPDGEEECSVEDSVNTSKLKDCENVKVEMIIQSKQNVIDGFICQSWNDVLKYKTHLTRHIKNIYISDLNIIVGESNSTNEYVAYTKISDVLGLLDRVSYSSTADKYLVVCGQALEIDIVLTEEVLQSEIDTQVIEEFFNHDMHKEAMLSLMRECLLEQLNPLDRKHRLKHLIQHFNAFSAKILCGYQQFIRNYSFDKVRKEYQEKTTEYISKINKSFDDVSAKALSIPAGVWLAAMQINESPIDSFQFLKNSVYCLMVLILVCIVCFTFFGQFSFINALKAEYVGLFERLHDDLDQSQSIELLELKGKLNCRYWMTFFKLLITILFTFLLLIVTVGLAMHAIT
ncbi:hypothetical protein [Aliivibrio sifiae]|uniref:hypothetical protein n=1 Tax=Aliivibrio sifiae TaxID=566293 RepID=UPI003D120CDE